MVMGEQPKDIQQTVFTHMVNCYKEVEELNDKQQYWDNVLFIGHDVDYGDVFKVWDDGGENNFTICFGVKGDEFL